MNLDCKSTLWIVILALACGISLPGVVSAHETKTLTFEVTIAGKIDQTISGQKQLIDADTVMKYSYARQHLKEVLSFDFMSVKVAQNQKALMDTYMSRTKFINGIGPAKKEILYKDAPAQLQQMLKDGFDTPICEYDRDKNGGEIKHKIVALPGAKSLIDNGVIANARLFHVMFPQDQKKWQAKNAISMGNGGYARGELTYQKMEAADATVSRVQVTGTLINASHKVGILELKDAKYEVTGEQIYDFAARKWRSGKLDIKVSYTLNVNGKSMGAATGTMLVKMKSVDPSASDSPAPPATPASDTKDKLEGKK
jgi:hypothetical protein